MHSQACVNGPSPVQSTHSCVVGELSSIHHLIYRYILGKKHCVCVRVILFPRFFFSVANQDCTNLGTKHKQPESSTMHASWNWDEMLAFKTPRFVRIRDRRLGIMNLVFLGAIVGYIGGLVLHSAKDKIWV